MNASLRRIRNFSLALALACVFYGALSAYLSGAPSGRGHSSSSVEAAQDHPLATPENVIPRDPFLINNGLIPPPALYQGPMFALSKDWPSRPLPPIQSPPWQQAIGGDAITTQGALVQRALAWIHSREHPRNLRGRPVWSVSLCRHWTQDYIRYICAHLLR